VLILCSIKDPSNLALDRLNRFPGTLNPKPPHKKCMVKSLRPLDLAGKIRAHTRAEQ